MLFLAVTLGFFVENQREHYVEHLREKQYAKSLYTIVDGTVYFDRAKDEELQKEVDAERARLVKKLNGEKRVSLVGTTPIRFSVK